MGCQDRRRVPLCARGAGAPARPAGAWTRCALGPGPHGSEIRSGAQARHCTRRLHAVPWSTIVRSSASCSRHSAQPCSPSRGPAPYGVSITASGAASAEQQLATVAQQYGNTTFQAGASQLGAAFSSLAGRQLTTVSAHEALKDIGPILLVLAGISLLASLLRLAGITGLLEAGRRPDRCRRRRGDAVRALPDAHAPWRTDGSRLAVAELGHLARAPERGSDRRRGVPPGLEPGSGRHPAGSYGPQI